MSERDRYRRKYRRLKKAVLALYTAAMWEPDRDVPHQAELWANLRDAAGIKPGTKMDLMLGHLRDDADR
ncbi:hypothetical protein SAMN02745126_03988 [Enhydrobacter aerosaccus]|uniref:Uncharacterized protein n=1 Tax=Enhydrobacter aerosaccus TaxID=225324 RepID=A0A1T4RNH1_9HYPH|nr:hypothetical protein [Enhydrobacter aerosaccus]SKA17565.1 hypothetical protein SAMN02745126_03988 [Enhydrobacter aerosaccus]